MLKVEKWAEGRNFLIALFGPQVVATAQDISESFAHLKDRQVFGHQFPLPSLPVWHRAYRTHRNIDNFLKELFSQFSPFGAEVIELFYSFTKVLPQRVGEKIKLPQIQPTSEEFQAAQMYLQSILTTAFQELASDFSDAPVEPSEREAFMKFFNDNALAMSFFMLVHIPCWLMYKTSPVRLYRKARTGDVKALDKLLRLDPLLLHDPAIGRAIQRLRYNGKKSAYRKCIEAPLKPLNGKINKKRAKYIMAGFLSAIAKFIKQRLTERELRDLFHDTERDISKDNLAFDLDLLVNPSTFAKAVERERKSWLGAMKSDK